MKEEKFEVSDAAKMNELKDSTYEIFILALSLLSIFNLILEAFVLQSADLKRIIYYMDIALSAIFLADFLYRLFSAESKRTYLVKQLGWLDFLGSLPFPRVRILRLARVIRAWRLLGKYGLRNMLREFITDRAGSALFTVGLLGILMIEFGSLAILFVEGGHPEANIHTGSDALWWSLVTMSTVGYGDFFPVTNQGRMIGTLVIILGVGLFGVLTGFLANAFLGGDDQGETATAPDTAVLLAEIQELKAAHLQTSAEIGQRLQVLEGILAAKGQDEQTS